MSEVKWAYGVMTVPQRRDDLLPRTLASLVKAGFDKPRLFVDGAEDASDYREFGLEVTTRYPAMKTFANWVLSLWELYLRNRMAHRYLVLEDDLVACLNLRQYLEKAGYPERGYCNLFTCPANQELANELTGWYESDQRGRGAVGLLFNRKAVVDLLAHENFSLYGQLTWEPKNSIDGPISRTFEAMGWKEYVHNPSLLQHTGDVSAMSHKVWPGAPSFRGEDFDATYLIEGDGVPFDPRKGATA